MNNSEMLEEVLTLKGIHEWAHASISKCDGQVVPDLWRNIVVSGGNTLLPGMFDILFVVD
jgi:actin-related protein